MGSLELDRRHQPLKRPLPSARSFSLDWSESVKLVIEDFPQDSDEITTEESKFSASENGPLHDELILLKAAYALSNVNRRLSLCKLLDLQGNVRVLCRLRPYFPCESSPLEIIPPSEVRLSFPGEAVKSFKFDKVFPPTASQENVFWEVQPAITAAMDGQNVCIFSYGQTGTGKTFTMEGLKSSPGIVPRSLHQLFDSKQLQNSSCNYRLTLSMLEMYRGALRDLLVPRSSRITDPPPPKSLSIHMSMADHVEVENLTEYVIENAADALKLYRKGLRARSTSTTSSNENSSRSHCLVRVNITRSLFEGKSLRSSVSKLWLIDLGGSERFFKTQSWGKPLDEGKAINVSLTALGDVISALQKKQTHIPYRNSKLTQILRDCLGCNSKVIMIVHASPREEDYGETICSLSFASRARGIHLNRDKSPERESRISGMVKKMQALEDECKRLSVDIQALESSLGQEGSIDLLDDHRKLYNPPPSKLMITNQNHRASKLEVVEEAAQALPRFMTPTISSLSKNRLATNHHEQFDSVWPERKLSAKLNALTSIIRQSPQASSSSVDFSRRFDHTSASKLGGSTPHQKQDGLGISPTIKCVTSNRNLAKIQRRLTLECSSKVNVQNF